MKSAILSGKDSLKLWNPIQSFHRLPAPIFPLFRSNWGNNPPRVSGLRSFTTSGWVGLSECRVSFPWHCNTSWSIFWNAGHLHKAGKAPEAFRRQLGCYRFGIPNLDSANMSGRQLRVRKEKKTTEMSLQLHTVQNGIKSTSESSPGEVEKLNKENFEVGSWQFQLMERHEANNLNSYTVAELRKLLREMKKQPKGQKSDLLKAVKSWLSDHGCQTPSALEEESAKGLEENSIDLKKK